jgi:hypothetical protein
VNSTRYSKKNRSQVVQELAAEGQINITAVCRQLGYSKQAFYKSIRLKNIKTLNGSIFLGLGILSLNVQKYLFLSANRRTDFKGIKDKMAQFFIVDVSASGIKDDHGINRQTKQSEK